MLIKKVTPPPSSLLLSPSPSPSSLLLITLPSFSPSLTFRRDICADYCGARPSPSASTSSATARTRTANSASSSSSPGSTACRGTTRPWARCRRRGSMRVRLLALLLHKLHKALETRGGEVEGGVWARMGVRVLGIIVCSRDGLMG